MVNAHWSSPIGESPLGIAHCENIENGFAVRFAPVRGPVRAGLVRFGPIRVAVAFWGRIRGVLVEWDNVALSVKVWGANFSANWCELLLSAANLSDCSDAAFEHPNGGLWSMSTLVFLLCPGVPWSVDDALIRQVHQESCEWRAYYGLPAQELDETCCVLAQQHAEHMARYEWFEHGRNDQVICRGPLSAGVCVSSWIGSGPHRAWLLSGNRKCGWGHAVSRSGTHYWCGVFRP